MFSPDSYTGDIFNILISNFHSHSCPKDDLTAIYQRLANPEGEPTPEFKAYLRPNHTPTELKINLIFPSYCDGVKSAEITKSTNTAQKPITQSENFPPYIINQVDRIDATEGEYLIYKVKEDFCYDPEDLGTRRLNLTLLDSNSIEISETNWLQFDSKNQEFYGLPMGDGLESYVLTCTDSGG